MAGVFLYPRTLICQPCPSLCKILSLTLSQDVCKFLVDAPHNPKNQDTPCNTVLKKVVGKAKALPASERAACHAWPAPRAYCLLSTVYSLLTTDRRVAYILVISNLSLGFAFSLVIVN